MKLGVNLAGRVVESRIGNAAGTSKRMEGREGMIEALLSSAASIVTMGSVTDEERMGNEGDVYWASNLYSVNSLGLPNPGKEYYRKHLPEMVKRAHDAGKVVSVSVAGFKPQDYEELTEVMLNGGADMVEENLGCPNVWGKSGDQKPIASFVPDMIDEILERIEKRMGSQAPIAIKLSPFTNPFTLVDVAKVMARCPLVKIVVATNTFPNVLVLDENGKQRISIGDGLAGLGGGAMKPIGMGQVKQFRKLLPPRIQIVGVGGIRTGQDVLDYLHAGADAVQIATAYLEEGSGIFSRILMELTELVDVEE